MKLAALIPALALGFLPALSPLQAAGPMADVKGVSDKIVEQLRRPDLQGDANKRARQRLVRDAMEGHFAWELSSQLSLGKHWARRAPEERAEFVGIFSLFLKDTYSEKIATYYANLDTIQYNGEKIIEDSAQVKVSFRAHQGDTYPVEYRLRNVGGKWLVYDVVIEGVSLVKNYRDQFDAILGKTSWQGLIDDLRARQKKVSL